MVNPDILNYISIHNTMGAVLIGFAASCCVYGFFISQLFAYFTRFTSDRKIYKISVIILLFLETADQIFIGHLVYYYGIIQFSNFTAIVRAEVTWSFILQQTVGATVGAIVKTFFALRVWRFSERNLFITGFLLVLTYGQLGLAMTFTVKAFELPSVFDVVELRALGTVALGVSVLTDIVVAGSLCYFLNRLRTGYHKSDTLVNGLVRYAVSTGALTGAVGTTTLILYNVMPENLVFIAVYFTLSKLYAISFMATLNTRRVVKGKGTDKQGTSGQQDTNLFHLGTRVPTLHMGAGSPTMDDWMDKDTFPLRSFAPPMASYSPSARQNTYGEAV